jgi:hypothetical protein
MWCHMACCAHLPVIPRIIIRQAQNSAHTYTRTVHIPLMCLQEGRHLISCSAYVFLHNALIHPDIMPRPPPFPACPQKLKRDATICSPCCCECLVRLGYARLALPAHYDFLPHTYDHPTHTVTLHIPKEVPARRRAPEQPLCTCSCLAL